MSDDIETRLRETERLANDLFHEGAATAVLNQELRAELYRREDQIERARETAYGALRTHGITERGLRQALARIEEVLWSGDVSGDSFFKRHAARMKRVDEAIERLRPDANETQRL